MSKCGACERPTDQVIEYGGVNICGECYEDIGSGLDLLHSPSIVDLPTSSCSICSEFAIVDETSYGPLCHDHFHQLIMKEVG
jgi:hypothetical protein